MILLIVSKSLIVSELLKIVLDEKKIDAEYVSSAKDAEDINYNIIFIDNSIDNLFEEIEFIKDNLKGEIILLGNADSSIENRVEKVVNKPFLPEDIAEILNSYQKSAEEKSIQKEVKTNILDPLEIVKIKELMQEDDDDDIDHRTYLEKLEDRENLKLKKKEAKEFLYEILPLTKKELKRLLKGAKISIKIDFKKSEDE